MKYVILIYSNPATWGSLASQEQDRVIKVHSELIGELTDSGEFLNIYRMSDASNTRTVHLVSGAPVVTDGPFGESKELLASLWEIEVESLDRALEIAAPLAEHGAVELRPIMDASGLEM